MSRGGRALYTDIGWRIFLDLFSRGTFFIVNILVARSLSVSEFGMFAYAISLTQIFYVFTDLGTNLDLISELGRERGRNEGVWIHYFELKLILMALTLAVFSVFAMFFWHWDAPWLLILALFWMFSNSILDFNQFVCNGLGRIDLARKLMLIQRSILLAGVAVPLFFHRTLAGIIIGFSIGGVLGAVVSNTYGHRLLKIPFRWTGDWAEWKKILLRSIPLGISGAFGMWYLRFGFVVLAAVWGSQVVGEYSAAFRIYEITFIVPAAVMSIALPHLTSAVQQGRDLFLKELKRIAGFMSLAGLGWFLFLYLGSTTLPSLLLGSKYQSAGAILAMLAWAGGLVFLNYVVTHLMVVFNFQKRLAFNYGLTFSVCVLLCVIWIPSKGAMGAAQAIVGTEMFLFLITVASLRSIWRPEGISTRYDTIPNHER